MKGTKSSSQKQQRQPSVSLTSSPQFSLEQHTTNHSQRFNVIAVKLRHRKYDGFTIPSNDPSTMWKRVHTRRQSAPLSHSVPFRDGRDTPTFGEKFIAKDEVAGFRAAWQIQKVGQLIEGRARANVRRRVNVIAKMNGRRSASASAAVNKLSVEPATLNNVEFNFDSVLSSSSRRPGTRALIRAVKHLAAVKFPMRPAGYGPAAHHRYSGICRWTRTIRRTRPLFPRFVPWI